MYKKKIDNNNFEICKIEILAIIIECIYWHFILHYINIKKKKKHFLKTNMLKVFNVYLFFLCALH